MSLIEKVIEELPVHRHLINYISPDDVVVDAVVVVDWVVVVDAVVVVDWVVVVADGRCCIGSNCA